MIINAMTIDLEDYFQVQAFSDVVRYENWDKNESRVERNTYRILEIFADPSKLRTPNSEPSSSNFEHRTLNVEHKTPVKATFFCLGWIAERYPHLIREIQAHGHEIACHGYAHRLIYQQTKEEFKEDIHKAKGILEEITGREVVGYRAPSYSITSASTWALDVLMKEGFKYDSSIFPIRHDFYGMPEAPRFPFLVLLNGSGTLDFLPLDYPNTSEGNKLNFKNKPPVFIIEFPLTTSPFGRFNLPMAGGGYFRLFPYLFFKNRLTRINKLEGQPFIFYLHPWEVDADQPRIRGAGLKSRFRHYRNLEKTEGRLRRLLKDFSFAPLKDLLPISSAISETQAQGACHDV
jgi:polysaccharide deacetylase family protein (PEP-CTERM system associated)